MNIRIDIRFDEFSHEYHADIGLAQNNIQYVASDNLSELLNTIKQRILEHINLSKF